ncbi:MAG: hypothetical protein ACMXYA_03485, partial [Candidatus Woesearchaeota archaeon]
MKKLLIISMMSILFVLAACVSPQQTDTNATQNMTDFNETTDNNLFSPIVTDNETESLNNMSTEDGIKTPAQPSEIRRNGQTVYVFTEGDFIQLNQNMAYDPDGGEVSLSFSFPFNQTGGWQTTFGDAGNYSVMITASDGTLQSTRTVYIELLSGNQPPVIENFNDITVNEGSLIVLNPRVIDPDGDNVTITFSGWMNSNTYQTTFSDAGVHQVTLTADDGK